MLGEITLEKYKEEIELKLTDEKYIVCKWVAELNKPSIIPPRKKPISNLKKRLLEEEESESDSSGHSHTCECSECIPRGSFEVNKSYTLPDNETEYELSETKTEEPVVLKTEYSTDDTIPFDDFSLLSFKGKTDNTLIKIYGGSNLFSYMN